MADEERDPGEIVVSRKHFTLRVILFILALALGLGAVGYGVYSLVHQDPGVYTIDAQADRDLPYNTGVHGQFYFDGSGTEIKAKIRGATVLLSTSLRKAYLRTDESKTYTESSSIGVVNAALDQDVTVDERVYAILQDAYAKTLENNNFSLFAGPLYEEWERLCLMDQGNAEASDPERVPVLKEYLEKAREMVSDLSNFELTFKGNGVVRLHISDAYKAFREEYEVTAPILSLNILKDAYKTQEVVNDFVQGEYKRGLIYNDMGDYALLEDDLGATFFLYDYVQGKQVDAATLTCNGTTAVSLISHFKVSGRTYNPSYFYHEGGKTVFRSTFLNLGNGVPNDFFTASVVTKKGSTSILETRYLNNALNACLDVESLQAKLPTQSLYLLHNDEKKAYVKGSFTSPDVLVAAPSYQIETI